MKKKIGELYDKPIVIGNPNEFTKNEISLETLTSSGEEKSEVLYFDVRNLDSMFTDSVLNAAQLFKTFNDGASVNPITINFYETKTLETIAVGFCTACLIPTTIEGEVKLVNPIEYLINAYGPLSTLSGLKQITEEEFYNLNE